MPGGKQLQVPASQNPKGVHSLLVEQLPPRWVPLVPPVPPADALPGQAGNMHSEPQLHSTRGALSGSPGPAQALGPPSPGDAGHSQGMRKVQVPLQVSEGSHWDVSVQAAPVGNGVMQVPGTTA